MHLYKQLEMNIQQVEQTFENCGDIVKRKFPVGGHNQIWLYVTYIDGLSDRSMLEISVISKLMMGIKDIRGADEMSHDMMQALIDNGITTADLSITADFDTVNSAILSGDTALFIDGYDKAIIISTKGWPSRGVPTTETEVVVQGSKEAFSEGFRINTMLIRRRIKDVNLKLEQMTMGRRSETNIALMYLQDVVRPDILRETQKRLQNIDIDAILDCGYIDQLICDDWLSPFPQTQITERPDTAAAAILEGRIVIVVDNSPCVIIVPATFDTFFQAADDYYQNWQISSVVRFLRFICGFIALATPGLYLAMAVFHPSMLPMHLVFKMAGARQTVPFPAVAEILIMEAAFELLREAGIRLPGPVGGAVGIVGGLVVGQAAVEAGIVSPIVVIIIALTGIANFAIPHYALSSGFRIAKYLMILLSAMLGLFGFWAAMIILLVHLTTLKSFGVPYLFPFVSGDANNYTDWKDTIFRLPLFTMRKRPFFANPDQSNRLSAHKTGNPKKKE